MTRKDRRLGLSAAESTGRQGSHYYAGPWTSKGTLFEADHSLDREAAGHRSRPAEVLRPLGARAIFSANERRSADAQDWSGCLGRAYVGGC
jgi:hypothetical protein